MKHGHVQDFTERLGIQPGTAVRGKADKFDVHAGTVSMADARTLDEE